MRVGEEMGYLEFLFHLPRMSRGVVDFLDDSHWGLRQQNSEEEWQLQYACFETNALLYKRGKNGEMLSDQDIAIQRRTLRLNLWLWDCMKAVRDTWKSKSM